MSKTPFGKDDLLALIDADANKHILLLQALIRTPSPNPPGDTFDAINVVRKCLDLSGISSELITSKPEWSNLVSVLHGSADACEAGSNRSLVLNGHIDQFPVGDANRWERDPYSGDVEGGYVYGRSGVDMKAGTAASIIAFSYLHQLRAHISGRVTLEVVSDEEAGGQWGTRYLLDDDGAKQWGGEAILHLWESQAVWTAFVSARRDHCGLTSR
jgi:succinyl-diaminopimelate desuccinylase